MSYSSDPNARFSETEAVTALATANDQISYLAEHGLALVPSGYKVEDIERFLEQPRRIKQQTKMRDVESFLRYVRAFRNDEATAIFGDCDKARFVAVLDYHTAFEGPSHSTHTATLQLEETREWAAWKQKAGKRMSQVEFARFIEDHAIDVVEPESARLMEAVRHIEAVRNVTFESKVDLDKGDLVFRFGSETKGKGQATLPERIALGISVYRGTDPYRINARLRYHVADDGDLSLWYDFLNADEVHDEVTAGVQSRIIGEFGDARYFEGSPS